MLDHKTHTGCALVLAVNQSTKVLMPRWWCKSLLLTDTLKQTIHETTFVAGDRATRSSAHKKSVLHSTSHWEIHLLSILKRLVECISCDISRTARTDDDVAWLAATNLQAVYVLNKLHWLIQTPQSKQYYHMGLSMSMHIWLFYNNSTQYTRALIGV